MDFLSTLHTDVKLLLVAGALALLAALLSATKKNEHRYMAVFTVVMLVAGYRFHVHEREDEAEATARANGAAVQQTSRASSAPTTSARTSTR
jgi:hypothetical protein